MARQSSEFVDLVVENLQPLGPVVAKSMFGGHGIFMDGLMFALVADDQLFFKVDDDNRPAYEAKGLAPFTYTKKGKAMQMSYREAPSDALDDPESLCEWAREAFGAALRSRRSK